MKYLKYLIFISSLLGLGVSAYLAYEYELAAQINCPIGGLSCDIVRNSIYSKFLGISVPFYGIAFYIVVAILSIILIEKTTKLIQKILWITSLAGFIFSVYLTFLEAFVILAFCFWCVVSATLATLIFLASTMIHFKGSRQKGLRNDKTLG